MKRVAPWSLGWNVVRLISGHGHLSAEPVKKWSGAMYSNGNYWPPRSGPCPDQHILLYTCPFCVNLALPNLMLVNKKKKC